MWLCYPVYKKIYTEPPIPLIIQPLNNVYKRTNSHQCELCNYIVLSPHNKCKHNYCDYCIKTHIRYTMNKCIFCN